MVAARRPLLLALGLLACAGAPGCLGTRHGHPDTIGSRNVKPFGRADAAPARAWRQVLIGQPRPAVRGYLRTESVQAGRDGRETREVHWIYDHDFKLRGQVSSEGVTVRIDHRGAEHREGAHDLRNAVRLVLGAAARDELQLAPMPDPA